MMQCYRIVLLLLGLITVFSIIYLYFTMKRPALEAPPYFEVNEIQPNVILKRRTSNSLTVSKSAPFFSNQLWNITTRHPYATTNLKPSVLPQKHAVLKNKNISISVVKTSTCPPELELDRKFEEWFVKMFKPVSPYTMGLFKPLNPTLVILTPISNMAKRIKHYFCMLCSLTYPKHLISIVLGEDSSIDDTYTQTRPFINQMRPYYNRVEPMRLQGAASVSNTGNERHDLMLQKQRRQHLADARNNLLQGGLKSEDWVLWLDSDVKHIPNGLIEHVLSAEKDIVTINCLYPFADTFATYDKNTWRETNESLRHLRTLPRDSLMLEGYGPTRRKYLNDLKDEGAVVRLDGVGGCALLVRASLHRQGLKFPNHVYRHHIETEGLAKMAAYEFKASIYGLPFVTVMHP